MSFGAQWAALTSVGGLGWREVTRLLGDCSYLAAGLAVVTAVMWPKAGSARHRAGVVFLVLLTLLQFVVAAGIVHLKNPRALVDGGSVGAGLAGGILRLVGSLPAEVWISLMLGGARSLWQLVIQARSPIAWPGGRSRRLR